MNEVDKQKFWDDFSKNSGDNVYYAYNWLKDLDDNINNSAAPVELLIYGLEKGNNVIKWFCAYKAAEYYKEPLVEEIKKDLESLLGDPSVEVKNAADFSLQVLNGTFNNNQIIKSNSGEKYAFTKYNESRYNDGVVWLSSSGEFKPVYRGISAGVIGWSPDDKWLSVKNNGRIWSNVDILNIKTGKVCETKLFGYISGNSDKYGYKIDSNKRPDPYVNFMEWSPDSKKVLLSYTFTDDDMIQQCGLAVYNMDTLSFEKIEKLPPISGENPAIQKPEGFKWY